MSAKDELRYEFGRYVDRQVANLVNGNATDYKPTAQAEIDRLKAEIAAQWERGAALLDGLDAKDRARCEAVYSVRTRTARLSSAHDFASFVVGNQRVVGPLWLSALDETRQLAAVFAA